MAVKPPRIGDVLQQINDIVGNSGLKTEVDKSVRALVQTAMGKLEIVSREEFDAQAELLKRTLAQVDQLEEQLDQLSKELEALE